MNSLCFWKNIYQWDMFNNFQNMYKIYIQFKAIWLILKYFQKIQKQYYYKNKMTMYLRRNLKNNMEYKLQKVVYKWKIMMLYNNLKIC